MPVFQRLCEEKGVKPPAFAQGNGVAGEWTSLQVVTARQALMDTNFLGKPDDHRFETRSFPDSLAATHRGFTF